MAEKKVVTKTVTTEEIVGKKKSGANKKPARKKAPSRKKNYSSSKKSSSVIRIEKQLMENFVSLQKVLTTLGKKLDENSKRMAEFLDLFEEAAKSFVKDSSGSSKEKSSEIWQKEVMDKIDNLFEQNKILARGLTLIHDEALNFGEGSYISEKVKSPIVAVPVKPETSDNVPRPKESGGESIKLNNKPRVKEEPNFDIQVPPFSIER